MAVAVTTTENDDQRNEQMMDGEAVRVETIQELPQPAKKRRATKIQDQITARDQKYLIEYIVTKGCRRVPWDTFFENSQKGESSIRNLYGALLTVCAQLYPHSHPCRQMHAAVITAPQSSFRLKQSVLSITPD